MGLKNLLGKTREQWQFQTERDPDLWDREKDDWRAAKAAKQAKQAKGGKK